MDGNGEWETGRGNLEGGNEEGEMGREQQGLEEGGNGEEDNVRRRWRGGQW